MKRYVTTVKILSKIQSYFISETFYLMNLSLSLEELVNCCKLKQYSKLRYYMYHELLKCIPSPYLDDNCLRIVENK